MEGEDEMRVRPPFYSGRVSRDSSCDIAAPALENKLKDCRYD